MKKIKSNFHDIVYISRITQVTKKRLRIFLSVLLSNTTVLLDIGIIVFSNKMITCLVIPVAATNIPIVSRFVLRRKVEYIKIWTQLLRKEVSAA